MTRQGARRSPWLAALAAAWLLAGCGGGGGGAGDGSSASAGACTATERKTWLRGYFDDWYFWTAKSPKPAPGGGESLDAFFSALLYTGNDASAPADRWSYYGSTESFQKFFNDGVELGYGVMVAGREVTPGSGLPVYVRYVDPGSPAEAAGVRRGDVVVSGNGQSADSWVNNDDFSVLSPDTAGQSLSLVLRRDGVDRTVTLTAAQYALAPVRGDTVITNTDGRKLGYLLVKDMVAQAEAPYAQAFARFQAAGVSDVVIDLRYNGGGLVSTSALLASYVAVGRTASAVFASLRYNSAHSASDASYRFSAPAQGLSLSRVYVLAGPRTASASELLVNGLKPYVDVVTIGATTYGKPVGFRPIADACGSTWSVVNFESVNASGDGRYWNGMTPTCAVPEDFTQPLGQTAEPLLATALNHAQTGQCGALALGAGALSVPGEGTAGAVPGRAVRRLGDDPVRRRGMLAR